MLESEVDVVGQTIAERWLITSLLGHGLMSHVYKAQDIETGKIIVLKLIKNNFFPGSVDLSVLDNLTKQFIALNHENIASYYNLHISPNNQIFLFCDYLEGQSLGECLAKSGKLNIDHSIQLFQQITAGLCYAHEKNIHHGDLRPSNIFIVNDQFSTDEAKIVDFGFMPLIEKLAKKHGGSSIISLTKTVNAPDTSPEQKSGRNIDPRCDLYSLGCLMYETLTGKPPYVGTNAMATTYKQNQQNTTALHEILPSHPLLTRYQTVINKLLKANGQERYQSASELRADLDLLTKASDSEWLKKANALKQSTYSKIIAKRWQIFIATVVMALLIVLAAQITATISPYYQPWTGTNDYNDSRLWVVQERRIPSPSISIVKQKYLLAEQLSSLKKDKAEFSPHYTENLFQYSRALLACGQWNEAKAVLFELQKRDLKNTQVRLADVLAHLAMAYFMLSDLPSAEKYCQQALKVVGEDATWIEDKVTISKILGDIYTKADDETRAMAVYKEMHNLAWQVRLRNPADYAYACALLADSYRKDKQYSQAERLYKEAIDWGNNFIGQKQLFMAKAFYGMALTEYQEGETTKAQRQLQLALPIAIAHQGNKSNFVTALKRFNDYLLFHLNLFAWAKQHNDLNSK